MSVEEGTIAAGIVVPAEAAGILPLWAPVVVTGRSADGLPIVDTTTTPNNPDIFGVTVDHSANRK